MKSKAEVGCSILIVLTGICLVVTASLLAGVASWGVRWAITAIGWLAIAAVIIPLCDRVKVSREIKQ